MIVWGLEMRDSVSLPANAAAKAMGSAAQQAKTLAGAMNAAQSAMTKAAALGDAAGVRKAAASYHQLREALEQLPQPVPEAKSRLESMTEALQEMGPAAKTAAGIAAVGIVALGAAVYEGSKLAIDASENVKRLTSTFEALEGGAKGAGEQTLNMLRSLEKELPQNEATLAKWTRTLQGAGITDFSQLSSSLKAVSAAEALAEGRGQKVQDLLAKMAEQSLKGGGKVKFSLASLAGTGIGEQEFLTALGMTPENFAAAKKAGTLTGKQVNDALVKALSTKAAGPLAAQMDELGTVEAKAADMAKRLFEGVDTKPLVDGVKHLFSIFDDSQPSGQVMKAAITGAFNAIFTIAGKVFDFLYKGFERLIIISLQAAIFVKQHVPLFEGIAAVLGGVFLGAIAAVAVATWGYVAAAAAAAVATIAATWPFLLIGAAIGLVAFGIYELVKHWAEVKAFFVNLAEGALAAGKSFVEGLVGGIVNGVTDVINAAKKLGQGAINAVRSVFQSHSPSQLMLHMGKTDIAGALATGMERGTGDVEDAAGGMGAAGRDAASGGSSGAGRGGGGGTVVHVQIDKLEINASHATSPAEHRAIVEEEFGSFAERLALMIGSAPEPA